MTGGQCEQAAAELEAAADALQAASTLLDAARRGTRPGCGQLGQLLRLRIDADYGAAPLRKTGSELRELLDEAAVFVQRCRGLVDVEIAKGVKDPDPPPDL